MDVRTKKFIELTAEIDGVRVGAWDGVEVAGISIDSRKVEPGDLFVALPGLHTHGMYYVEDAVNRGVAAVVIPPEGQVPDSIPAFVVQNPRQVLASLSARFYDDPSRKLFVFGVTGTNGKSTTAHMVAAVFGESGSPAGVWSTPEVYSGRRRFRPKLTTPESHELQRFFREVLDTGMHRACIEVSSHGAILYRVAGVDFDVGAVTNISRDHLDFHGDFESYFRAKQKFVENLKEDAVCLINRDDPYVARMQKGVRARVVTYGFAKQAALRAHDPVYTPTETTFEVTADASISDLSPGEFTVTTQVPGRHNIQNTLVAIGAGLAAGIPLEVIRKALRQFKLPPRRLETMRIGPYTVINDVAMNGASYRAVLETMEALQFPQMVVVNAIRGNRGPEVNARIAEVLAEYNKRLKFAPVIVSESESSVKQYEVDYRVRPEELNAFVAQAQANGLGLSVHRELSDAINEGVARLKPGGVLLLLGTFGMDDGASIAWEMLQKIVENGHQEGMF